MSIFHRRNLRKHQILWSSRGRAVVFTFRATPSPFRCCLSIFPIGHSLFEGDRKNRGKPGLLNCDFRPFCMRGPGSRAQSAEARAEWEHIGNEAANDKDARKASCRCDSKTEIYASQRGCLNFQQKYEIWSPEIWRSAMIIKRKQYLTASHPCGTLLEKGLTANKGKGTSDEAHHRHHQAVQAR